ncbi:MAG: murein hydrolase activator EnvC family protein [Acidobacteriota bacterium]
MESRLYADRRCRGLIVWAGLAVGAAAPLWAAGPAEVAAGRQALEERRAAERSRLERIREEIRRLGERLARTERRAGSIIDALDEIDLRMALLARERAALRHEERATLRRIGEGRLEARDIERRLRDAERELRAWLREAYKVGPMRYFRIVAASASPAQVAAGHRAIERLSRAERRRIDRFRAERARLDAVLKDLERDRVRLARVQAEIGDREADLREARRRKEAVLSGVRRQQASQRQALRELAQVERDIQDLLARLERATPEDGVPSLGFRRFRGLLDWPAPGAITVPFGNVRHPRFNTQVPHPGIDIAASPGEQIRTIFDGRVVFSDWFRGYGPMIVIDHGDGYLSVYGHLGERWVEVGREVRQGDPIGRADEPGTSDGVGLYFEIRHDGEPQDPALWLRPPSTTVAVSRPGRSGPPGSRSAP